MLQIVKTMGVFREKVFWQSCVCLIAGGKQSATFFKSIQFYFGERNM